ncbi:MAG: hypothetical protein JWM95_807, partial [Gemmatimonadetes bacterium]|nr:hypothetical protein [Gemmatimonadota bacterium]
PVTGGFSQTPGSAIHMKQSEQVEQEEPVGIVISSGREQVPAPRFSAYVWAYGPDDELEAGALAA